MVEPHPLTEYIPELAGEAQLVLDIEQNGIRQAVVLHEGKIIEGRVRYRAAVAAGTVPATKDWSSMHLMFKDPLEWMLHTHVETHAPDELALTRLVVNVLPYFRDLPGKTEERINKAAGLSVRKIRTLNWLLGTPALQAVLDGEKSVLEAGRETGLVSEKHGVALGKTYGHDDNFDDAVQPFKRYLSAWKRRGYEFRHLNSKEALRRLSLIDSLVAELQALRPDLERRSVKATLSMPPERKKR